MKKLRLKVLSLGAREILSREQLRSITGGACQNDGDCEGGAYCSSGQCWGGPSGVNDGSGSGNCDQNAVHCEDSTYVVCSCNCECHPMLDCDVICH
jgi:hypothetical protein